MEAASTLLFTTAVRLLGREARRLGLSMPGFRCPPRVEGVDRTLRRRIGGSVTVAVRLRDRPMVAVLADMVDGVVAANALSGAAADQARSRLWAEVASMGDMKPRLGRVA